MYTLLTYLLITRCLLQAVGCHLQLPKKLAISFTHFVSFQFPPSLLDFLFFFKYYNCLLQMLRFLRQTARRSSKYRAGLSAISGLLVNNCDLWNDKSMTRLSSLCMGRNNYRLLVYVASEECDSVQKKQAFSVPSMGQPQWPKRGRRDKNGTSTGCNSNLLYIKMKTKLLYFLFQAFSTVSHYA